MSVTKFIAQHIIDVHEGDNWTDVNIKNSVQNISVAEAENVTKLSANTIAALLYHIIFYNEAVLERLNGGIPVVNDVNIFDVPQLNTEEAWQQLKQRNLQSAHDLAEAVIKFPEEKLFLPLFEGSPVAYKTLHGIIEHAHYHLGQIVLIRNFIKNGYDEK
jgi:uncharacterized damage-inducible protein DinB